jgi:anti-sigma factor RsiW
MKTNAMGCEAFTDQLLAYLEHEVDDATRAAIERHSVTCGECGALLADLRKLRIDAANLPLQQPSRDLWAGIAARIEAPVVDIGGVHMKTAPRAAQRPWVRGALLAASLVGAAGVGYLAAGARTQLVPGPLVQLPPDTVTQVVMVPDSTPAVVQAPRAENREPRAIASAPARPTEVQLALATLTADYDREIARLRTLIEQRRNQLDPLTVGIIEKNLNVIDTAIDDSKKAIARDPASRYLIESLNQSLRSKVELMRTAALLPSRT